MNMVIKMSKPKRLTKEQYTSIQDDLSFAIATRNVYLMGPIDNKSSKSITKILHVLDRINKEPIRLYICSEGGYVSDSKVILDTIYSLKNAKIDVIGIGYVESCAADLLILSPPKHRWITPTTYLMLHSMYSTWDDPASTTKRAKRLDWEKKLEEADNNNICKATGITKKVLKEKLINEWYLHVDEALKLNMIDGVWK